MNTIETKTFTAEYAGIVSSLRTQCKICKAFNLNDIKSVSDLPPIAEFNALWDTGVEGSVISKRVAQTLGLKATSKAIVYHAGGGGDYVDTYSVNISLPNKVKRDCFWLVLLIGVNLQFYIPRNSKHPYFAIISRFVE